MRMRGGAGGWWAKKILKLLSTYLIDGLLYKTQSLPSSASPVVERFSRELGPRICLCTGVGDDVGAGVGAETGPCSGLGVVLEVVLGIVLGVGLGLGV